jgi:hypothetical protein
MGFDHVFDIINIIAVRSTAIARPRAITGEPFSISCRLKY